MDLSFYNIIKGLLKEEDGNIGGGIIDKINYAINNKKYISLFYNDQKGNMPKLRYYGNPRGFRRLIPYCLGERNGRIYLRCFHAYYTNTKRGPGKWKLMKINNMKNVRVYDNWPSFEENDLPSNINKTGDKQMTRIINIVNFDTFVSPLERERQKTKQISAGREKLPTNKSGYIKNQEAGADQKKKITAKDIARIQPKYNEYEKNINKEIERLKNNLDVRKDRWQDYDKAYGEMEKNPKGPIENDDEEMF